MSTTAHRSSLFHRVAGLLGAGEHAHPAAHDERAAYDSIYGRPHPTCLNHARPQRFDSQPGACEQLLDDDDQFIG